MDDYCNGIAYATGYFANENGKTYLIVRNVDPWCAKMIEKISMYRAYESKHNFKRDGKNQWTIKARDINFVPHLRDIENIQDFCRAYIEIHGVLDMMNAQNRKGDCFKKPRLRIYGKEDIISFLNIHLPAKNKKIQSIKNNLDDMYTGKTHAIYYQSAKEISDILQWLYDNPKNERIWGKWKQIVSLD